MAESKKAELKRATGAQFVLRENTPEFFAEGVSEAILGVPMSKLTFHTSEGVTADGIDKRVSVVRLVLPTNALLELCRNVLAQSLMAKEQIAAGFDLSKENVNQLLEGVELTVFSPPDDSREQTGN